jgi:hypothetical protein
MSQTDPTPTDPEVYLLQSPKTYRINPFPKYSHKYGAFDVDGYVVFAKTRKPNYNSINPVSEVAQIVCFPFYAPCNTLDSEFNFDFPGDTENYFVHWDDRFARYFERPMLSGSISNTDCLRVLNMQNHYGRLPHRRWESGLAVPSWSREKIWNPLVHQYGWNSVAPSPQMKAALFPIMEAAVQEWELAHNPNSYVQSSIGKKQTKYNYAKTKTYLPLQIKEIEKYDYEPSRNYALDA